jgi:hypothetical protein
MTAVDVANVTFLSPALLLAFAFSALAVAILCLEWDWPRPPHDTFTMTLGAHPSLNVRVERMGNEFLFFVTRGPRIISAPLIEAFHVKDAHHVAPRLVDIRSRAARS